MSVIKLPVRKCFYIVKVVFLVSLVVSVLTLFEYWRGGRRSTYASQYDDHEMQLELQVREDEARIVPGLGEGGVAVHLTGEEKRLGEESEKKLAMNVYLSNKIAYNRTLKGEFPCEVCLVVIHNQG